MNIHKICNKKLFGFCSCSFIDQLHINCIECEWKQIRLLAHQKGVNHPEHVPHLILEYIV